MYIRVGFVSSSVVVNRRYRVLVFQRVSPDIDFSAQCYYDQNSSLLRRKEKTKCAYPPLQDIDWMQFLSDSVRLFLPLFKTQEMKEILTIPC